MIENKSEVNFSIKHFFSERVMKKYIDSGTWKIQKELHIPAAAYWSPLRTAAAYWSPLRTAEGMRWTSYCWLCPAVQMPEGLNMALN